MTRIFLLWALLLIVAPAAHAAVPPKPLFATSGVLHLVIRGPIKSIARNRSEKPRPAALSIAGSPGTYPITLAARGITRRQADVCQFPPLKLRFTAAPPRQSLFAGQKSLKLVTHCRNGEDFQQHMLLEYAAYRMFNLLSPASFNVRLATIDYVDESGRPVVSRYGFFIEDLDDVASRNGMKEAHLPELIPVSALSPGSSALYAMFQHMIANHDWSMRAGPKGDDCCHNAKMIGPSAHALRGVIPIPYDFDFSGLVDAPYATPPGEMTLSSVRQRRYRGYCVHNRAAFAAAARIRAAEPRLIATLAQTPGLDPKTARDATDFLGGFFADIATDELVQSKVLRTCVS